jgi:Fur family iron response transcriptional regulator
MELCERSTFELACLLREHGITATLQRVEIGRILFRDLSHLSAEQIRLAVNFDAKSIVSKATVYNTLKLFVRKGLVKEVIVDPTKVFYEPKTTSHHHCYNVDTGELIDFQMDRPIPLDQIITPDGTSAIGVDITVRVKKAI